MLYQLAKPLLFALDPEVAHNLTLSFARLLHRVRLPRLPVPELPVSFLGMSLPNPVGLAAGLDKNGEYIDALAGLGFGFLEIGTVTPRPQPGNPRPRLFRLPRHQAIINRMGFNNKGIDRLIANVKVARYGGVLGINIGKNFDTPLTNAAGDYVTCLRKAYLHASYIAVNISSPNTAGLRDLQQEAALAALLTDLKHEQADLAARHGKYVPLAVKIAPDLSETAIDELASVLRRHQIDAVIATNTTLARDEIAGAKHAQERGGLSGKPLFDLATAVQQQLRLALGSSMPIIGVGGIVAPEQAVAKRKAGADLLQLYTGLIYRGPALIGDIVARLAASGSQ